jgi:hypothetical protein
LGAFTIDDQAWAMGSVSGVTPRPNGTRKPMVVP